MKKKRAGGRRECTPELDFLGVQAVSTQPGGPDEEMGVV